MLSRATMHGIYAISPTPFKPDGRLDEVALRHNVRTFIAFGIDALVSCGSSGEFFSISDADHARLAEVVTDEAAGRLVNVVGSSAVNTDLQIARTSAAKAGGADAVMNLVPFYAGLTWPERHRFWHELADAVPGIGLIIYNFSKGHIHSFEELAQLAEEIPAICGTKEGHYDWDLWLALTRYTDLAVLSATEKTWWVACRRMGTKGFMSMSVCAFPRLMLDMDAACLAGEWQKAEALEARLRAIWDRVDALDYLRSYGGVPCFKAVVNAAGWLRCGRCHQPLISVPEALEARLRTDLLECAGEYINPEP